VASVVHPAVKATHQESLTLAHAVKRHFGHIQAQLLGHAHGGIFAQRRVRRVTLLLQFGNPLLTLV
jgi:hypothetical protein